MKKVLYIDDEADSEKMASKFELMSEEGFDVVPVCRLRDVIPMLKSLADSLDVIVLDLAMPPEDVYTLEETEGGTLTGLRLLQDIRRYAVGVPAIIVTVRRRPSPEKILPEHGVSLYLEKPISAAELIQALRLCLREE
jgi:CheY-like chemotaxis protein